MRIKRHDKTFPVYDSTDSLDSEGNVVKVWTKLHDVTSDVQPTSDKSTLEEFGIKDGDARIAYCDLSTDIPLLAIAVIGGKNWQSVGLREWYDHSEIVLKRYYGSI